MTIEAKIDALIAALNANTAALQGGKAPAAAAPKADAKAPAAAGTATEPKGITYDDVKAPFLQLVKDKGRDAGVAVLAKFSAAKLPDVKPEQFKDVLAAIKAASATESALA